ncbi:MAG: tetratricopeptide repeat protein, partial [Myxococcales bacterium]|nr:tetratricopeptide repeat protein [Myxococcales bacterium]
EAWAASWSPASRDAVAAAMRATEHPAAEHVAQGVARGLDDYGVRWMAAHREACLATHQRGEQSLAALDRRMACLEGRRAHAHVLVERLRVADRDAVERAMAAVDRLPSLDACEGSTGPAEPLPDDARTRMRVQALRARLADARVRAQLGRVEAASQQYAEIQVEADAVGYRPLMVDVRTDRAEGGAPTEENRDRLFEALHLAEAEGYVEGQRVAWTLLAATLPYLGEYAAAERAAEHARAFITRTGNDPVAHAELLEARAFSRLEQSEHDDAVTLAEEALRALRRHAPEHPRLVQLYGSLGTIYTLVERNAEAREAYQQAYDRARRHHGEVHGSVAFAMMNLGRVEERLGRTEESNAWYLRSIEMYRALGEESGGPAIIALNNLGQNYGRQGRHDDAIATVQRAIEAQARNVGPEHRQIVRMRRGLARILDDAGRLDEAMAECEQALRIAEATFGDEHDETATTRRRLGEYRLRAGERELAISLLERALRGHERPGTPAQHRALSQYSLFVALADGPGAREQERARALAEQAIEPLEQGRDEDRAKARELREWLAR